MTALLGDSEWSGTSVFRSLLVVVGILVATVGCSLPEPGPHVHESLTAAEAQRTIYGYFSATLGQLPVEVGLSKTPDSPVLGTKPIRPPLPNPCWDGNLQSNGPRYLSTSYWVVGVPAGGTAEYFTRIAEVWRAKGWQIDTTQPAIAKAVISDGFGLQLQDAGKGDSSLNITGFSPCLPETTIDGLVEDPATISHP